MCNSNSMEDLIVAIHRRDVDEVNKILTKNPSLLCFNNNWRFLPLMNAICLSNCEEIVEALIEHGADLNYKNPLGLAIVEGSLECIKLLLEKGASLTDCLKDNPPSIFSRDKDNLRKDILQLLLKYDPEVCHYINNNGENLFSQLISCSGRESDLVEISEILLNLGVPLEEENNCGFTPLRAAIFQENVELVSFFISKGADTKDCWALFQAAMNDNIEIVEMLLSNGANIHIKNDHGWTALHMACRIRVDWANDHVISYLIKRGAKISEEDNYGKTPFSMIEPGKMCYEESIIAMIKEFAKLSFENVHISEQDMDLIQSNVIAQDHFEMCKNELFQMLNAKFQSAHSFYSILKKTVSTKKLACLSKNKELVTKYEENLKKFFYYKSDLQSIWEEVIQVKDNSEKVYSILHSIFHNYLPSVVIEKLSENLTLDDLLSEENISI